MARLSLKISDDFQVSPNGALGLSQELKQKIENSASTAEDVIYTTTTDGNIANVKQAIDNLIAKVYYVAPTCQLVCQSAGTFEIGTVKNNIQFTWTINKDVTSILLTDIQVSTTDRQANYDEPISTNKTFTLKVSDGQNDAQSSVSFAFLPKIYYGSANVGTYDSAFILSLQNDSLKSSKAGSYTINVASNQYAFIAMPTSYYNEEILITNIGGFDTELVKVATISHTNASGYTQNYAIYKTYQHSLGEITIKI